MYFITKTVRQNGGHGYCKKSSPYWLWMAGVNEEKILARGGVDTDTLACIVDQSRETAGKKPILGPRNLQ